MTAVFSGEACRASFGSWQKLQIEIGRRVADVHNWSFIYQVICVYDCKNTFSFLSSDVFNDIHKTQRISSSTAMLGFVK